MIHVIGMGSIGALVAHTIRSQGVPVTLVVRSGSLSRQGFDWTLNVLSTFGGQSKHDVSSGYHFQSSPVAETGSAGSIRTLVVCTKAYDSASAVLGVSSLLDNDTNIVTLNNGLGVEDEVRQILRSRSSSVLPKIYPGLLSHGAYKTEANTIVHAGLGPFWVLSPKNTQIDESMQTLMSALRPLGAEMLCSSLFRQRQLEKLLINAVINPITAITGEKNGSVDRHGILIEAILSESLEVLRQAFPAVPMDRRSIRMAVDGVVRKTKDNRSSMLQDVSAGRRTEVDYINGAIIRMAKDLHLRVDVNKALVSTLKRKIAGQPFVSDLTLLVQKRCDV